MTQGKISYEIETSLTVKDLLEAGAHFGHQTRKWHPKVAPYLLGSKNAIHIIDVSKALESLRQAGKMIIENINDGKSFLFVGTKRQARDVVALVAKECGEFFVNERWSGGLLTNPASRTGVEKMARLRAILDDENIGLKKKEISKMTKRYDKLYSVFHGITDMKKLPGMLIVVDVKSEALAISEAKKLNIPVIGIVDTNSNPQSVDCPIVINDDSVKSLSAAVGEIGQIIMQAKEHMNGKKEIAEDELKAKIELDKNNK
ncbi:MAG: 30S ribosomal protein S2 [Chlamydiia bacterium]|nr:30S ribosomal protein S2 [Chlamydiia bacterium]